MAVADDLTVWTDEEQRAAVARATSSDRVLAVPQRRIDARQLERALVLTLPDDLTEGPRLLELDLTESIVEGPLALHGAVVKMAAFEKTTFTGALKADGCGFADLRAGGAVFSGRVSFDGAAVDQSASFTGARFDAPASFRDLRAQEARIDFDGARFLDDIRFDGSEIRDLALPHVEVAGSLVAIAARLESVSVIAARVGKSFAFARTEFLKHANFGGLAVEGAVEMREARFECPALMATVRLMGHVDLRSAAFSDRVDLRQATVGDDADLSDAFFARADRVGPLAVGGKLILRGATFERAVDVEVATDRMTLERARFHGGANLLVRFAVIDAEYAIFGEPSLLADSTHAGPPAPTIGAYASHGSRDGRTRVESVRSADVGDLTLSNVDLTGCRFFGAHNLDKLRIDSNSTFALAPARHARRRALAEEFDWRVERGRKEWDDRRTEPAGGNRPVAIGAGQIAGVYRELRRGQEERKDEPGAADFYYGEMEMRRHGAAGIERVLLSLYWLVSGYGLRASRAFAALLLTIALFAVAFRYVGFDPDASWTRAVLFSAESTSSLFRVPATPGLEITEAGEVLQIWLRLLGPLFFGLMLLSIRGRVKR